MDEQVEAAGMLSTFSDGSGRTVDSPLYISGESKQPPRPAPGIGEHSEQILADLGYDSDAIENLKNSGAVGA